MARWRTQFVDLPDATIAFREHGSGPPLILLHGNSESKRIFARYQRRHFTDLHTLALDSRGHGQSKSQTLNFSIGQYAEDVIAVCKRLAIEKANVIGYSDGGNIALHLACKAPRMFPKIIAISPNYLVSGTTDGALRLFRKIIQLMEFLGRIGLNTRRYIARFNLMMTDIGLSEKDLRGIRTGVSILYAEKDLIKEDHIKQIAQLIPGAGLHKIKGSTHLSILKRPEAVLTMRTVLVPNKT